MSHPFNTFALKMRVHCKICGKELKKELLKIKGVGSVEIDQELGKVVISGKVDPAKVLAKFEKDGREAELWVEQELPRKDIKVIARPNVIDPLNDPDIMAQLEKCSDDSSVKSVEVTKTVKVTFKGKSRTGPSDKTVEVDSTTNKNVKKTHDHHDHSNGDGLCAASSSCCGGHSATSHNLDHGCFQYGNAASFGPSCAHGGNSSYNHHCLNSNCTSNGSCYANGISPSAGPIWSNDNIPSAPPLPDGYFQAPPSVVVAHDYFQAPPSAVVPYDCFQAPPSSTVPDDYFQAPPTSTVPDDYFQAPPSLAVPDDYFQASPSSAVPDHYYQAPPSPPSSAIPHPYHSVFSEENVNGCVIM